MKIDNMKIWMIAFIVGFASVAAPAENLANAELDDLIQYARDHNPGLQAAYEQMLAAAERIGSAGSLPDPTLTYGYFFESVETRLGPQKQKFSFVQKVPWLQKLGLRRRSARQATSVAEFRYQATARQLVRAVKKEYFEYRYLFAAERVTRENIQLLEQTKQVVRTASGTGTVSQAALLRILMKVEELKSRLERLTEQRQARKGRINALLNRETGADLPEPQSAPVEPTGNRAADTKRFTDRVDELAAIMLARNPDLLAVATESERARTAVDLAHKSYFPDLALGFHFIQTGDALDPTMPGSGQDPLLATISFGLPLWPGNHGARREEAQHRLNSAQSRQRSLYNELKSRLETAVVIWRDASRQVDLYRDRLIPLAQQVYQVTVTSFAAGQEDYTGLISAQRELLNTHLSLHRAIADRDQARAEIEMLVDDSFQ